MLQEITCYLHPPAIAHSGNASALPGTIPTPRGAALGCYQAGFLPVGGPALPMGLAHQPMKLTRSECLRVRGRSALSYKQSSLSCPSKPGTSKHSVSIDLYQ